MAVPTSASHNIPILSDVPTEKLRVDVGQSLWSIAFRRFRRDYLSIAALITLLVIVVACYGAPVVAQILNIDPNQPSSLTYAPPGVEGHILGTDDLGRDQFVRLLNGGQISLAIGFFAGVLALTIGVGLGVLTGYRGGIIDDILNWFITTLDSLPQLYLLLLVTVVVRASLTSQAQNQSILASVPPAVLLVCILSLLGWTGTMRLVRGETFSLREREYVLAARAVGASDVRIMFTHILPNVLSVILITLMIGIGELILIESTLSFLGFGIQLPTSTWGNMLTKAQEYYKLGPHLIFAPGILITITVLCLFILGDGLRDAFDPKLKEKA